ncbi:MAG: ABC transporter ATP-binding protein [Thermoguttaceae bacterium]
MIEIKELSFTYHAKTKRILERLTCDLEEGCFVAILGRNGAGKSTLLKCLNKTLRPNGGAAFIDGKCVERTPRREMAKKMATVSQRNETPRVMVFDSVLLGRTPHVAWNVTTGDKQLVEKLLGELGIASLSTRYLDELSGGELQKASIARALAQEPKYLLLDEPTNSLDIKNQYEILKLIQEICRRKNISVVAVLHDLNLARRYCDRFLLLKDSTLYSYGGLETVTPAAIKDVYDIDVEIVQCRGCSWIVPLS